MITARNYAAQVECALLNRKDGRYRDQALLIKRAVHVSMPDNGRIFDDELKGLVGRRARLPYPVITVECFFTEPLRTMYRAYDTGDVFQTTSHKRLVLAVENMEDEKIYLMAFIHIKEFDEWVPHGVIYKVPFCVDELDPLDYAFHDEKASDKLSDTIGENLETIANNMRLCMPMFELLEALTCRNVTIEPLEKVNPSINAKRIKAGKLPIYETRVLTIKTNDTKRVFSITGGSHASPRQHLRRGHIRRLENGNIWVNSCVVGDPTKGVINKQYAVV